MELISINIGEERSIQNGKSLETTGIYKRPEARPVEITENGLARDVICDKENHGGVDQAVYVYGMTDYGWWSEALGRELGPGTFGENLTIAGCESARFSVGDRLYVGAVVLQVTAPRIPCSTLAGRMEDPFFVRRFRAAERPGLYCRVLATGFVQAGDPVRVEPYAGETVTVLEMFRDHYVKDQVEAAIRHYLAAPIAARARAHKERQLQALLQNGA